MQVPNGFGCGMGVLQLMLYSIYRKNKKGQKANSISKGGVAKDNSLELGSSIYNNYNDDPEANGEKKRDIIVSPQKDQV